MHCLSENEKYHLIAMDALCQYFPNNYRMVWLDHEQLKNGVGSYPYSTDRVERLVIVPRPYDPTTLFIFLHEIGHFVGGEAVRHIPWWERRREQERNASRWAKERMEARGIEVPAECWKFAQENWENFEQNQDLLWYGRLFLA